MTKELTTITAQEPQAPARVAAPDEREAAVSDAASRLYDAEIALHIARQTGVDAWISAAYDRLHEAIVAHTAAVTLKAGPPSRAA